MATYEARKAEIEVLMEPLRERIKKIEEPYRKTALEEKLARFPEEIRVAIGTPEAKRTPGQQLLAAQVLSINVEDVSEQLRPEDQTEIERLKEQLKEIQKELSELPLAMGIRDGDYRFAPDGPGDEVKPGKGNREVYDFEGNFLPQPGKAYVPPPTYFLPNADYRNKGPEVEPGFLQVVTKGNPPTGAGGVDHLGGAPTDGKGHGQPPLAASFRPWPCDYTQQLRSYGPATLSSEIVGLVGDGICPPGLEHQVHAPADDDLAGLPDVVRLPSGGQCRY